MLLDTLAGVLRIYQKVYGLDIQTAIRELRRDALTVDESTTNNPLARHIDDIVMQAHRSWATGEPAAHRHHKEVIHP